jgi:uncharacterized protein YceK
MTLKRLWLLNLLLALGLIVSLVGCNTVTRRMGGTQTVDLPKGQKFIEATWKDDSLWYTTRPMRESETAETFTFQESSNMGVLEGKVIFKESK